MKWNEPKTKLLERAEPYRPLLYLALLSLVAFLILCLPAARLHRDFDDTWLLPTISLYISLTNLLPVWTSLGTARWPSRVLGFVLGAAGLAAVPILFWDHPKIVILAGVQASTLLGLLLLARLLGIRGEWASQSAALSFEAPPTVGSTGANNLSIRDLLLWVGGFAALFGAVQKFVVDPAWLKNELVPLGLCVTAFNAATVCVIWVVFGTRALPGRLIVLSLVLPAAAETAYRAEGGGPRRVWFYSLMAIQTVLVLATLVVSRRLGFRIVRRKPQNGDDRQNENQGAWTAP